MSEILLEKELNKGIYVKRPLLKAIRLHCLDCCGGSDVEVKECAAKDTCFLHPYRLRHNPFFNKKDNLPPDSEGILTTDEENDADTVESANGETDAQ